jgi:protein required for attachment to host cells
MRKVWIVVANSSEAKIYRAENAENLVEHGMLFHDESRMAGRDLVSDGSGREGFSQMVGTDTYDKKTSPKIKEYIIFAEILANFLEEGYRNGQCDRIYLIAKAPFLGHLRQSLSPHVAQLVESEIHKDLTKAKADEIRGYLPLTL